MKKVKRNRTKHNKCRLRCDIKPGEAFILDEGKFVFAYQIGAANTNRKRVRATRREGHA